MKSVFSVKARERDERIKAFIILRLFIVTLLLFLAHNIFQIQILVFYHVIATVCILSLVYLLWFVWGKFLHVLLWIQIFFDILLETVLVHYTGGIDSSFAPIYILSILSGGILIAPWASFVIAGLSSGFFGSLIACHHFGQIPQVLPAFDPNFEPRRDPLYLFYASYVRVTIFFVVAVVTNYMTGLILKLEERVRLQERLAFLGDVTSRIAHEIRNPLAAISGSVEVLMHELKDGLSERNVKLMGAIIEESERLKRVFGKMLDYARFDDLKLEKTPLEELLDRALMSCQHAKEFSPNVIVVKKYEGKRMGACVDSEQMIDVFSNVIRNAYEAMPAGGTLNLDLTRKGGEIEISVSDTGCGIEKNAMKNLFTPFKTSKKTGAGLGLAQVQKIMTLHGGRVDIESASGKGTHVRIYLRESR